MEEAPQPTPIEIKSPDLSIFEKDKKEIEHCHEIVAKIRSKLLEFAQNQNAKEWLIELIQLEKDLDGLISDMRHLAGGQEFILQLILEQDKKISWYRGGTRQTWKDQASPVSRKYFTREDLNTVVIDGGANGGINRSILAKTYLKRAKREKPVIYTVPLASMLKGVRDKSITLVSEHKYDLSVLPGEDRRSHLDFCRENVTVEDVDLEKLSYL